MYAAGTDFDSTLRVLAKAMSASLKQQVLIDNRPGAGGVGAVKQVASAQPDGYTLLAAGAAITISQSLFKPQPYDLLKQFKGVSTVIGSDLIFVVGRNSKVKTFADLVNEAKRRGSGFMVGIGLLGTSQHLAAELFKLRTHLDFTIVPYRSPPALFTAMQGGELDLIVEFASVSLSQIRSGNLRPLLVCGIKRSRLLPDIPTTNEAGVPDLDIGAWGGILAPATTPDPILQQLSLEVRKALALPEVRDPLINRGLTALGSTPEQTMDFWRKRLRASTA
ncbi:hypothetical protein AWV79_17225 [Cupriavidus sp. UYMMa02A]|nr:hypothetical protein AWV79_17225 [Cupriavidus sp. UYMMa02A]